MSGDTVLFTTLEESALSKICKKEQAAVKQKPVSLKNVNQAEIVGAELDVMRDLSKVLNKKLTKVNDEKQDDEDALFGKLVAAELKSSPQRQKYRLKHEINNFNLTINYKTKTMLIIVSKVQIQFKDRLFMLNFICPFKMQGIGIMYSEIYDTTTNFSCVSIYNNKNYINIVFPEYNRRFVLGFCAISSIRKHKQRLRRSLTFKIFNTFLVGINMFKVSKKTLVQVQS